MKSYTCSVDIQLPRDIVVDLFHDPDNLPKWQDGFVSWEHLEGESGQVGFKAKLHYTMGKNSIELIETITNINMPEEFDGTYEWKGGKNTLINRFTELSPDSTRWESTCEYEFKSFGLKLMGLLVPFVFKQQNQKFLDNFKAFAELGADVRNPDAIPELLPDESDDPAEQPPP